jgi:hypothetical protein
MGNGRSLGREAITVDSTDINLTMHRTDGTPTIFAGFRQGWLDADVTLNDGSGKASATLLQGLTGYLLLEVTLPDGTVVYEYADMREFFERRVSAILSEKGVDA